MPTSDLRPLREDIPSTVDTGDVLHELRMLRYEWNGDLRWLRRFRTFVDGAIQALVIAVPVFALLLAVFVAVKP